MVNKKGFLKEMEYDEKKENEKEELEKIREACLNFEYDKEGNIRNVKVLIPVVAEYILNKYNFKTIFGSKSENIFVCQDNIYIKSGREIIQTQTEKILGEHCSNHYISEIVEKIKRLTAISKEAFDNIPEELICIEKGILNLKTQRFSKHDPKYYFKVKLPIEYDPAADCPKIKKFFKETLYPNDVAVMQEWFGYCLYRRYFVKKAMILFGEADTSKTVMLNLLTRWLGEKNTSGLSLQRISSGDKFRLVALENKYANICDDLTSQDLISGGFKMATGGGWISAEHKFGDQFQFKTYAKLIFAGNKIPAIKDIDSEDDAYYGRWLPIPFDNQIEKEMQDKFFINQLTTKEELSGLLNYALEGLKRILKKGWFSDEKDWKEVKKIMERHSNSISAFSQDVLMEKPGNKISKENMYEVYCEYLKSKSDSGFTRFSKEQLGRQLPRYAKYIVAKGGKKRIWENVDIKDSCVNADTFDTFTNIMSRNEKKDSQLIYKISKKVSKVSNLKQIEPKPKIEIVRPGEDKNGR